MKKFQIKVHTEHTTTRPPLAMKVSHQRTTIIVDGEEATNVRSVEVKVGADEVTTLIVELIPEELDLTFDVPGEPGEGVDR